MISIDDIIKIREHVKTKQNKKRYEHTLGVAYTAAALAFMYDIDPLKAELTGMLHDCAKCMSDEELITECRKNGIHLSKEELDSPQVIHAIYGSVLVKEKYDITDEDIINAVGSGLDDNRKGRWYDIDSTLRTAMNMLQNCPAATQRIIAKEMAKMVVDSIKKEEEIDDEE